MIRKAIHLLNTYAFPSVVILTILSGFFHFYNCNWGAPYYFHPDERNIASAVSQLHYPTAMNPNFFAYGSLPIYVIYISGIIGHVLHLYPLQVTADPMNLSFAEAILISRFYSALFATLLIPILFRLGTLLKDKTTGLLAAFFATTSIGFLQFSHFGTFEMWLTFFAVLLFWSCLSIIKKRELSSLLAAAFIFGILVSTKITSLALLPLPFIAYLISSARPKKQLSNIFHSILFLVFFLFVTAFVYVITNPYVFMDTQAFLSSMHYETGVGMNTIPVFYTQGFYDTIPGFYQLSFVYPFLLNPFMTFLFFLFFVFTVYYAIHQKQKKELILSLFFLVLFISQAFLFIKWTRYMIPTLPFIYLIIAQGLTKFSHKITIKNKRIASLGLIIGIGLLLGINLFWGVSYFITAFVRTDTRVDAAAYAKKIIPQNAHIISEMYDLGITAFNPHYDNIKLFNAYDTDSDSPDYNIATWNEKISTADYIILPSQRVIQTRMLNPKRYPNGNKIYRSLLNGESGFQKIYETPCDIFCNIIFMGDPVYYFEQTVSVFDRPTIMIFKKHL